MSRPLRIEFSGAVYHVTSRGNARQDIFLDNQDRDTFLDVLSSVVERFNWLCHSYCLMSNHYHVVIETPEGNLSRGMRHLNGVYTQKFNQRYKRAGHLFQGRYKAILVEKDSYLLSLCRYVVLNPVRAGMIVRPESWHWSSYKATVGSVAKPSFLTIDWILSQFGESRDDAIGHYRRFVLAGVQKESPWDDLKGQILLGSETFIDRIGEQIKGKGGFKEIPRVHRYATRPPLQELLTVQQDKSRQNRDETIYTAYATYGYTLKEIADYLGVHYATVSRAIKRVEGYNKSR